MPAPILSLLVLGPATTRVTDTTALLAEAGAQIDATDVVNGCQYLQLPPVWFGQISGKHTVIPKMRFDTGLEITRTVVTAVRYGHLAYEVRPGIDELCPCAGPAPDVAWKNHGRYVVCVASAAKELVKERAERMPVSRNARGRWRAFKEWWEYVAEAARSDCGRKRRGRW